MEMFNYFVHLTVRFPEVCKFTSKIISVRAIFRDGIDGTVQEDLEESKESLSRQFAHQYCGKGVTASWWERGFLLLDLHFNIFL